MQGFKDGPSAERTSNPKFVLAVKALLSVFLVYHLLTVLVMPNSGSLVGRSVAGFFLPYASTLSFNTTWQFFSPGPSPTYYLEYQVETADQGDVLELETYQYPPKRAPFSWNDFYSRRLYGMRFFTLDPVKLEHYFIPFLCRQTPRATGVWVQSVFERVPNIERADQTADFKEMSERFDLPRQRFNCPGADPALMEKEDGAAFEPGEGGR